MSASALDVMCDCIVTIVLCAWWVDSCSVIATKLRDEIVCMVYK
jgi:hypothetical protein